jgi:hypothetical protein
VPRGYERLRHDGYWHDEATATSEGDDDVHIFHDVNIDDAEGDEPADDRDIMA